MPTHVSTYANMLLPVVCVIEIYINIYTSIHKRKEAGERNEGPASFKSAKGRWAEPFKLPLGPPQRKIITTLVRCITTPTHPQVALAHLGTLQMGHVWLSKCLFL